MKVFVGIAETNFYFHVSYSHGCFSSVSCYVTDFTTTNNNNNKLVLLA